MSDSFKIFQKLAKNMSKEKDVIIAYNAKCSFSIIFQEHMCNIENFNEIVLPKILKNPNIPLENIVTGLAIRLDPKDTDFEQMIFHGIMVYYDHILDLFYKLDISKAPKRSVGDSDIEPKNLTGPRDGFTESYKDNIALIRTRLKNSNLIISDFTIGRRSRTIVNLLAIEDIHNKELYEELKEKLSKIDIDAVLSINDIITQLNNDSLFPFYTYAGTPDLASKHLLDGEFLIIIDRIPLALVTPVDFKVLTDLQNDFMPNPFFHALQKLFVFFCFFLSTMFLGVFLSAMTYQIDLLSLPLISILRVTEQASIFPTFIEIIFVLFLFEMYYLVGFRSSEKILSQTIVLIGGIIIGQNIIESGIVGVLVISITAICYLSGFMVSNNTHFVYFISISRFLFLIAALFFGLYGVTLLGVLFFVYLCNKEYLNLAYFSPFSNKKEDVLKSFLFDRFNKKIYKRNTTLDLTDNTMKEKKK